MSISHGVMLLAEMSVVRGTRMIRFMTAGIAAVPDG